MLLSEHFTLEEMTASETARRLRIANEPGIAELKNLQILCQQVLEPARKIIHTPLLITSGYRCKRLNQAVGGVSNSYHLQGRAADIMILGRDKVSMAEYAANLADALNKQPLTDVVLIEHSRGGKQWVHVQWSTKPRHHINLDYKA